MHKSIESQLTGSNIEGISGFYQKGGTNLSALSSSNLEKSLRSTFQRIYLLEPISPTYE